MWEEVRDFLLLSVPPGGEASVLFEDSAEITLGMEAQVLGDGGDGDVGVFQHIFRRLDAPAAGVFGDAHIFIFF